jgi:hypothetical protein
MLCKTACCYVAAAQKPMGSIIVSYIAIQQCSWKQKKVQNGRRSVTLSVTIHHITAATDSLSTHISKELADPTSTRSSCKVLESIVTCMLFSITSLFLEVACTSGGVQQPLLFCCCCWLQPRVPWMPQHALATDPPQSTPCVVIACLLHWHVVPTMGMHTAHLLLQTIQHFSVGHGC